jgi:hypothetical protein
LLLPFFEWCEATALGTAIRQSVWAFPVIEAAHLLGLCLLGGSLLVVDLRMLGLGLRQQSIAELARLARPWLVASVAVMIVTGSMLFLSEAVKCYYNTAFWVKITTLPVALTYTFALRERVARRPEADTSLASRLVGATSLVVWFVVAAAGRWIGFS